MVVTNTEAVAEPQDRENVKVDWIGSVFAGTAKYMSLVETAKSCFAEVEAINVTDGSFMSHFAIQGILVSIEPCSISLLAESILLKAAVDDMKDMRAALVSNTLNITVAEP